MLQKNVIELMEKGFNTACINQEAVSNLAYKPQFISNNYKEGRKVISSLEDELLRCDSFCISVAFITMSGITPLLHTLKKLETKGVCGRILTTDYLNFSEPKALKKLAKLNNIEIKMYCSNDSGEGFHTKGYIFQEDNIYKIIVGSSNITLNALTKNKEWNTKIISTENGEYAKEIINEFESIWNSHYSKDFSEFIDLYAAKYEIIKKQKNIVKRETIISLDSYKLEPNKMQSKFVENLKKIVADGSHRALLISSTGERVIIMTGRKSPVKSRAWAA